jgi:anti-sigma regulatory factor (Ser/Thr protein kinase)
MEQLLRQYRLRFTPRRLDRLKTAVAEATMNAIEHGNQYRTDKPAHILVFLSKNQLRIGDRLQGG